MFFTKRQLNRIDQNTLRIMANQQDLDRAVDNLLSVIQAKAAQVATDLQDLESKLAQAENGPDLSAEIAKINQGVDSIKNIDPSAAAAPAPTSNTAGAANVNPPPPAPAPDQAPPAPTDNSGQPA